MHLLRRDFKQWSNEIGEAAVSVGEGVRWAFLKSVKGSLGSKRLRTTDLRYGTSPNSIYCNQYVTSACLTFEKLKTFLNIQKLCFSFVFVFFLFYIYLYWKCRCNWSHVELKTWRLDLTEDVGVIIFRIFWE